MQVNLRLDRAEWAARRRSDIEITGRAECLEFFTGPVAPDRPG